MIDEKVLLRIKPGARVRIWERIKEGDKERKSAFEGIVLARKHGREPGATFTVRAVLSDLVGVEKVYPIYSPMVDSAEVISSPRKVRRAKLYYLRKLSSKEIKVKMKS